MSNRTCVVCKTPVSNPKSWQLYCSTECRRKAGQDRWKQQPHYKEHEVWRQMRYRCSNPNAEDYHRYGARGIRVCARWERFENFIEDMGPRPNGYMLERINNNGNYEPSNCMWAPAADQNRNKRNIWTPEQDATLSIGLKLGYDLQTISGMIGRSPGAIETHLRRQRERAKIANEAAASFEISSHSRQDAKG